MFMDTSKQARGHAYKCTKTKRLIVDTCTRTRIHGQLKCALTRVREYLYTESDTYTRARVNGHVYKDMCTYVHGPLYTDTISQTSVHEKEVKFTLVYGHVKADTCMRTTVTRHGHVHTINFICKRLHVYKNTHTCVNRHTYPEKCSGRLSIQGQKKTDTCKSTRVRRNVGDNIYTRNRVHVHTDTREWEL